jgi:hypothetical protein
MRALFIQRIKSGDGGTFGKLTGQDGRELGFTVERPPTGDHPCIPAGSYPWKKGVSPHNGACLMISSVMGREYIEMHSANVMVELLGCIAPGATIAHFTGEHDGEPYSLDGVTNSKATLAMILSLLDDSGSITITDVE